MTYDPGGRCLHVSRVPRDEFDGPDLHARLTDDEFEGLLQMRARELETNAVRGIPWADVQMQATKRLKRKSR